MTTETSADNVEPAPGTAQDPFSLGVGGPIGFGGSVSPAKLAFVHGLWQDADPRLLELRVHGVGGGSPSQLLEQADYVQVGGDNLAQFVRRWGDRRRIVPWPLEGYWWGGLTSKPATRALWSLLFPLLLSNLAAWMAPARPRGAQPGWLLTSVGAVLAVALRWAGYALTLVFTASVATASLDTFAWQCTGAVVKGSPDCRVHWLTRLDCSAGPRLALLTLVPVAVLGLLGYAGRRTVSSYERWRIRPSLTGAAPGKPEWPLAATGFWHGARPVIRLQLLHLAGACGLLSLYLAWVPASHPGWRAVAIGASLVTVIGAGLLLAGPQAGRPGSNPYRPAPHEPGDNKLYDWTAWAAFGVAAALLFTLWLARFWWAPAGPPEPTKAHLKVFPGVLPGDAGIWTWLTLVMGIAVAAAFLLTVAAKISTGASARELPADHPLRTFHPFARGFLGPAALCLGCVTGGILAAGVNLAIPRLLIGSKFSVGPAYPDPATPTAPVEVPWPLFGFMGALLAMVAVLVPLAVGYLLPRFIKVAQVNMGRLGKFYGDTGKATWGQRWRICWQWSVTRVADLMGAIFAVLALAGLAAVIAFYIAGPGSGRVDQLVGLSQWLVGAGAAALYGYTLSALRTPDKRTRIQLLWDVGTFWPRACQPFAPPCYMERSVPELVNRLDNLLRPPGQQPAGGLAGDLVARLAPELKQRELAAQLKALTPRYDRILVNGYSQGAPIVAAAIAQLPGQDRADRISLVTVGSPLRRLYARGFPVYFGPDCLTDLRELVTGKNVRWRNAVRESDWIGGYIFGDPYAGPNGISEDLDVDKAVLDPVCVLPGDGDDATVSVMHQHSDFWPDPQVALLTKGLVDDILSEPPAGGPARLPAAPQPAALPPSTAFTPGTVQPARPAATGLRVFARWIGGHTRRG